MENIYLPEKVKIIKIEDQSPTVKLFRLEKVKGKFDKSQKTKTIYNPGQFVLVGQIGYGEAPFGILSSPYQDKYIEIAVRKAGIVTNYLHSLEKGTELTVRGPYGNGFPLDFMEGKDIVMVTGGCGIPPIAATIEYIVKNRKKFGNIYLIYGAKNPDELLLKDRMQKWEENGIKIITTIDQPIAGWSGHVGFVTDMIKDIKINETNAVAIMCGPGPMMGAIEKIIRPLGISDREIFVNMERKMQCGVGRCQHCTCGKKYVCTDGPVFNYDEIDKSWD